ncbi:MAG TPA: hypothetical protein VLD13_01945 [Gaiellaceae bacterium]|nr:hypothetical protein [Gaiellaceae bacterium]
MSGWVVERILRFEPGDFVNDGLAHFGFHLRDGRYVAIAHRRHYLALVGESGRVEWTVAAAPPLPGVPNVSADLEYPIYADALPDRTLVVSSFGNALLHRIDPATTSAQVLVDGGALGLADMGNCVVDGEGLVWVNEVTGCRLWRFDLAGRAIETLGDGSRGFDAEPVGFDAVRFGWIYDVRRGPGEAIYVLDSGNYALRAVDPGTRTVRTIAGSGAPGYSGDSGDARAATFGSDPEAAFDGPISLSVDEAGNAYVGDRFNHVVRMIDGESGVVSTIAGRSDADESGNDLAERDPLRLSLPKISSLDYHRGRLFVPTDVAGDAGELAVLRRAA